MNWRKHLLPDEAARLDAIPAERRALTREYKLIFERCRQREVRARKRMERDNG